MDAQGVEQEALGFARCMCLMPGGDTAELSITVGDQAQHQGIGSALIEALIGAARAQGIRRLHCEVLAENLGMHQLALQLGGEPHWLGDGILKFDCDLPQSDARDWTLPWYADPVAWFDLGTDTWLTQLDETLTQGLGAIASWDLWPGRGMERQQRQGRTA